MKKILTFIIFSFMISTNAFGWWTSLYNRGTPWKTYFLGDKLTDIFEFAVNQDTYYGFTVQYGLGKSTDGTGWIWRDAEWSRMDGGNRVWKSKKDEHQFTSTGFWYYAGKFTSSDYTEYASGDWAENRTTLTGSSYITVNALNNPSSQAASFTESAKVHLSWSKDDQGHNVMIVRYAKGATPTAPTGGTTYSVGSTLGFGGNQGKVVYNSNGTSYDDTGVTSGNNYDYYFYSENWSYYSSGVKATADYKWTWQGNTSTDWGTASNWVGGSVPTASNDVFIPSGCTYYPTVSSGAVAKSITINSGATLNGGSNTLTVSGNFTNNGTFNAGTGTVVFNAAATVTGTVTFNNITISANFTPSTNTTINGTFSLNSGYNVLTNAPKYGSSSTLKYNSGGTPGRSTEWSATGVGTIGTTAGYPNNVTVSNNTTLNCNNGSTDARAMAGSLKIESGSNFYCDYAGGSCALTVGKDITMSGNFSLGGSIGGDLTVGGNFTKNGGDFYTQDRAVTFNGTSTQTISGSGLNSESGTTNCFPYLMINNGTGGSVTLSTPVTVTNTLTLTNGVVTTSNSNILYISNTAAGSVSGGSSTSYINGPLKRAFSSGTASDWIFPVGKNSTFLPCAVYTPTGTSPLMVEAFDSNCGGSANGYILSSTEYWYMSGNTLTAGTVSLAKSGTSCTTVMYSSTSSGTYTSLGGSSTTVCSVTGVKAGNSVNPLTPNYFALATPVNYYFRSKNSSGTWGTASDWEYSSDNQNWSASSIVPGANALGITIQSGQTMKIASAVNISAGKLTVNGTLQLENGGSIDNAPIYASGSTLIFNPGSGNTIGVGKFWMENAQSGAGYPYNVTVASGKLSLDEIDSHDEHLFMANNLNVASGAELYLDMQDPDEPWNQIGLMVGGDITNAGTISMSSDCHQALSCDDFTNTGQTTLSSLSNGGDLYITGNFYNNGSSASAVNINGRALILTGNKDQTIGGSATGTYEIDYLIIGKSGGTVTVEHDLLCDGEGNGQSGGGAITVEGAILDISGRKVQIARNTAGFYSTITTNETGSIRTNALTKLYILGDESTKNVGTIRFDQTTPGTTNIIGVLRLNRSNAQAEVDVANNFIVADSLKIEQGKLKSSADIQLKAGAVGFLSSTHSTAALELNRMIFGKTSTAAAEFYKNGRSLTINGGVRTKITFDQTSKWHFMSFPYQVTDVKKSDGTTAAVLGTDYSLGWYDAATRATNKSGWKTSTDHPMSAGKGYIINKKSSLEDLYFDNSSVTGSDDMFSSSANVSITYTTGSPYAPCNFGWNFVAHPLSAKATPSLAAGEFAYSYNPANDVYKLYYYQYNPGYTYGDASGMKPFEAYFIKAASASNLNVSYSLSSPQGVRRRADAQPEDVVQLNLAANGTNYETLVRMKPEATAGYDELYDAPYSEPMNASTPRIYTLSNGTNYALALNTVPEETTVPVYVKVPQAGDYSFNWTAQLINLPVTLTDQQTGETIDLTSGTEYGFQTSTTEIKNRFYLNVPKKVITENVNIENTDHFLRIYPLGGNIEIEGLKGTSQICLADMAGHILQAKVTGDSHCRLEVPVAGIYMLFIRDAQHSGFRTKIMVW
jgi:hypothetical protein